MADVLLDYAPINHAQGESIAESLETIAASIGGTAQRVVEAANSATAAAASASNAATSASNAATSASAANTSKNNAATSATNAANSATAAANSATSAGSAKTAAQQAATEAQGYKDAAAASAASASSSLETLNALPNALVKETASGDMVVVSDGSDNIPMQSVVAEITPVQSGSGDPSPDNIRPISGRTGLTLTHIGKNLLPSPAEQSKTVNGITISVKDGVYTISGTASGTAEIIFNLPETITLTAGQTISFFNTSEINGVLFYFRYVNTNGSYWGLDTINKRSTIPNGREADRVRFLVSSGVSVNMQTTPMLCLEGYPQAFEPYKGTTYPVSWQTEAGTIYGGTLDVVSGVLTVDKYFLTCADTITPNVGAYAYATNPNRWQIALADNYMPDTDKMGESISDTFGYYDGGFSQWADGTFRFSAVQSGGYRLIQFKWDGQPTTVADLKELLAENPIHFVIPLATPQTYQLTPTEVRTLLGGNTIYTDAGDVSVDYIADTKLYIDNKIAELQALVLEN